MDEVLDMQFPSTKCQNIPFYKEIYGTTGSVVHGTPIICGGYDEKLDKFEDKCYKMKVHFDAENKTTWWSLFTNLETKRFDAASIAMADKLWVLGGLGPDGLLSSTEYVYIDGQQSTNEAKLPIPLLGHAIVALNDAYDPYNFILIGGYTNTNPYISDETYFYNSDDSSWTKGPNLIQKRKHLVAGLGIDNFSRQNYIVVAGGTDGTKYTSGHTKGNHLKSVEFLSGPDEKWTMKLGMYQ